jgi:cation diffusion facilitator CzcD-associated flavoprotein CzcO
MSTENAKDLHVIIVGAGISGVLLAQGLKKV